MSMRLEISCLVDVACKTGRAGIRNVKVGRVCCVIVIREIESVHRVAHSTAEAQYGSDL